jgi:voltage-gated potassium channel
MRWHKYLWKSVLIFIIIVILGSCAYTYLEGWSMLDSIYFVVITLTTIGYGDLIPLTSLGKLFTIFFSFFGIAFAFYVFSMMGTRLFKEHLSREVSEIKEETKEQEEIKEDIKEEIKEGLKGKKKRRKKK